MPHINFEPMCLALLSLNVPTQLAIYPGQNYGLSRPNYIQERLERVIEWYGRYLGGRASVVCCPFDTPYNQALSCEIRQPLR